MGEFISAKCRVINYYLRSISRIRKYLTTDATKSLVNAYIAPRLDYCNSLLFNIPQYLTNRLQILQNRAARLIYLIGPFDHITPTLISLHWLPIQQRIVFKIALLVYKALNGTAPPYLSNDLTVRHVVVLTRASNSINLIKPLPNSRAGSRPFKCSGPDVWSILPAYIKNAPSLENFKTKLKTFLFNQAYF